MPRKPKQPPKDASASATPRAPVESTTDATPARRAPSKVKKAGPAAARKASSPKPEKAGKKAKLSAVTQPTDEEIRLRAYFIAERRHRLHLHGDASSDWVEAKRQLLAGNQPK